MRHIVFVFILVLFSGTAHADFLKDLEKAVEKAAEEAVIELEKELGTTSEEESVEPSDDYDVSTEDPMAEPLATKDNIEDEELWGQLWHMNRFEWGRNFGVDEVKVHYRDVTCDGKKDYVATFVDMQNPDVNSFKMNIVSRTTLDEATIEDYEEQYGEMDKEQIVTASFSIPFNRDEQGLSLCAMDENTPMANVFYEEWTQDDMKAENVYACHQAMSIEDGMCDSPRVFWPLEYHLDGDVPLVVWRR